MRPGTPIGAVSIAGAVAFILALGSGVVGCGTKTHPSATAATRAAVPSQTTAPAAPRDANPVRTGSESAAQPTAAATTPATGEVSSDARRPGSSAPGGEDIVSSSTRNATGSPTITSAHESAQGSATAATPQAASASAPAAVPAPDHVPTPPAAAAPDLDTGPHGSDRDAVAEGVQGSDGGIARRERG